MAAMPLETHWADKPFSLVPTPSTRFPNETHSYVHVATEMANIHNVILRGLNAIVQQAPHVPEAGNSEYKSQDVADLLFFVRCWVELITHHHSLEEKFIFPEIEKFAGQPGLMEDPVHQHSLFHDGMVSLLEYATNTKPNGHRWFGDGGMKHIIDSFSEALVEHLYAEVDVLLGLGHLDSVGLSELWNRCEEHIKKDSPFGSMAVSPQNSLLSRLWNVGFSSLCC